MNPEDAEEPLPPVQMALLDAGTLDQLFFDIGASAELLEVLWKHGAEARASSGPSTLAEARDALVSGAAVGVQLRYRHAGKEWWDTLVRSERGVRLVRIERQG